MRRREVVTFANPSRIARPSPHPASPAAVVVSIVFLPNARLRCARRRDALIVADVTLGYFFANVHGRRGSAHTQRTYVVWGGRRRGVVVRTRQHSGRQSSGAGQTPPEINRIGESLKIFTNRFANTRAGVCVCVCAKAFVCFPVPLHSRCVSQLGWEACSVLLGHIFRCYSKRRLRLLLPAPLNGSISPVSVDPPLTAGPGT